MPNDGREEGIDTLRAAADDDLGMAAVRYVLGGEGRRHPPHHLEAVTPLGRSAGFQPSMEDRPHPLLALDRLPRLRLASRLLADCDYEV